MLLGTHRRIIEQACVTVRTSGGGGGRGVLVAGELILTAAHCVNHTIEGRMALGDYFVHEIETTDGVLRVCPWAVEPVTDSAVLGALDGQEFYDDYFAFNDWCTATTPGPISRENFPMQEPFPVYIYTHRCLWVEGTAMQARDDVHGLWITVPEGIEQGTSGSPIVTAHGAIVGVISIMGGAWKGAIAKGTEGPAPRPHLTLPVWIMRRVQDWEDA